jgi:heme-degrading monooxygenase HmoA
MTTLEFFPPPPDVLPGMLALPNFRANPVMMTVLEGPDRDLGPESAGAILMLSMTFSDQEKAKGFWRVALRLHELLAEAPGFIRRFAFGDDPVFYLIAFWRTVEDAKAFAARPEHRAAVKELFRNRWQYSHFAAIWEISSNHGRIVFCDECAGVTPASDGACSMCGAPIVDPFKKYDETTIVPISPGG